MIAYRGLADAVQTNDEQSSFLGDILEQATNDVPHRAVLSVCLRWFGSHTRSTAAMQRQLVAAYERRGECRWCVRESEREQQRNDVARSIGSNGPIKQCAYGVSYSAGLVKSPQAPSALRTMRSRYPGHGIIKVALGGPQGRKKLLSRPLIFFPRSLSFIRLLASLLLPHLRRPRHRSFKRVPVRSPFLTLSGSPFAS